MKRLHVHVSVDDLAKSIQFYSTLFVAEPTVTRADYAKWMLDDPSRAEQQRMLLATAMIGHSRLM